MRLLAAVAVLCASAAAHAGVCLSDKEREDDMKLVEAFARDKAAGPAVERAYGWLCIGGDRFRPRVLAACRAILDRDGDGGPCMSAVASTGTSKLGDHDLFAWVVKLDEDPLQSAGGVGYTKTSLLGLMHDPRGAAVVTEMWTAAIPRAAKREKSHTAMIEWSGWRQSAAAALGAIGTATDLAFLDEQAKATKDTHVADACRAAAAEIAKRVQP